MLNRLRYSPLIKEGCIIFLHLFKEGRDGEYPVRGLCCRHSEQRSVIQKPLQTPPMRHSSLRCDGSLCKVQDDNIHLPLIGEGWDGEYPVRALFPFVTRVGFSVGRCVSESEPSP